MDIYQKFAIGNFTVAQYKLWQEGVLTITKSTRYTSYTIDA